MEMVNRIITIGCEGLPDGSDLNDLKPRRLKGFAATVSAVCREWHALVLSPLKLPPLVHGPGSAIY